MKLLKREAALVLLVVPDARRDETLGELMDDQGEAATDGELRDRQGGRDVNAQIAPGG